MSNITFKMKRSGRFRANWLSRKNVCGVDVSVTPTYTFSCDLETTNHLDSRGFILDNLLVQKYFNDKYASPMVPRSCENIAWDATQELLSMLRDNGQTPLRVAVTVGSSADAEITCEWTKGHTKPAEDKHTVEDAFATYIKAARAKAKNEAFAENYGVTRPFVVDMAKVEQKVFADLAPKGYIVQVEMWPKQWVRTDNPSARGIFKTYKEAHETAKAEAAASTAGLRYRAISLAGAEYEQAELVPTVPQTGNALPHQVSLRTHLWGPQKFYHKGGYPGNKPEAYQVCERCALSTTYAFSGADTVYCKGKT